MVKVTTKDSKDELFHKSQEYVNELYDVLLEGVKIGLLQGHLDGDSLSPRDLVEGINGTVDEFLSIIIDEFDHAAKKKIDDVYPSVINDVYLSVIDEV